jgi:NifU-like protein involved in Fe-S cluster formation
MTSDPYSAKVRELFADPGHCGDLEGAVVARVDDQGVQLCLSATHADGQIEALRFRAWGCPHVIAACEAFCLAGEGRPAAELCDFRAVEIMRNLSIPVEKSGRILVLEDAVRSLGRSICDSSVP